MNDTETSAIRTTKEATALISRLLEEANEAVFAAIQQPLHKLVSEDDIKKIVARLEGTGVKVLEWKLTEDSLLVTLQEVRPMEFIQIDIVPKPTEKEATP